MKTMKYYQEQIHTLNHRFDPVCARCVRDEIAKWINEEDLKGKIKEFLRLE